MITAKTLFAQKDVTKNEVAKMGMDIYFNQLKKTDSSIYEGIFPTYNDWRRSMIYFGSRLSGLLKQPLLSTDLEIVRGNEKRVNFGGKDTTTDFSFVLNDYKSKKPIFIGVVKKLRASSFLYRSSKFDTKENDYLDANSKTFNVATPQELIDLVAQEVIGEIANTK